MPKIISFAASLLLCAILGLYMAKSDTGKAIRAVAKERQGARLVGIDVDNIFAVSYGIGIACLGAAACLLMPTFYVTPSSGHAFVLVAFTEGREAAENDRSLPALAEAVAREVDR